MIEITDINDSRINLYKSLRFTPESHILGNVFVAEGEKAVKKMLKSKAEISSVLAIKEFIEDNYHTINERVADKQNVYFAEKALLSEIIGFKIHSGVMAIVKIPDYETLAELSDKIIIMNGIVNSENVGAIVRNCSAFHINSIIFDKNTSSPYMRRAVRVGMGNIVDMKVHASGDISNTISELKLLGYKIICAELTEESIDLRQFHFPGKYALVLGSESPGVSRELLAMSDFIIKIPMNESTNSINVAAASAIIMYEATYG